MDETPLGSPMRLPPRKRKRRRATPKHRKLHILKKHHKEVAEETESLLNIIMTVSVLLLVIATGRATVA